MAKLYRRGKVWYGTLYHCRKRYRIRLGEDKLQAKTNLKDIEYRLSQKEPVFNLKTPLIKYKDEFLEYIRVRKAASTFHNYAIALKHLIAYLIEKHGVTFLGEVDIGMIDGYVSERLKNPSPAKKGSTVARSSVNTELKAIKRFFNRGVELGLLRNSPARKVKFLDTAQKNPRFFNEGEVKAILEGCEDRWVWEIYLTLHLTGLRIGELVNLEWSDVDFDALRLTIRVKSFWKPKGNVERDIPIHLSLYDLLQNKGKESNWVFTKADGKKVNIHSLESRFRNQLKKLGLQGATLHHWRHTFAVNFLRETGNMRALQLILGHKSIKTTQIYAHLTDQHLSELVNQLPVPKMDTNLDTALVLPGRGVVQVVENNDDEVVGDTGFEPVTSTV